jgi:hypothetical protein
MNINDSKILELRIKIDEMEKSISSSIKRFNPITNCILDIEDKKYNIHTLTKDELILLAIKINSYKLSANDLGYEDVNIYGFSLDDWLKDIKSKLEFLLMKDKTKKLKECEQQLSLLLSKEKQTELKVEQIEDFLKRI